MSSNWPPPFPFHHHPGVIRRASSYGPIIVELDPSELGSVRTDPSTLQRRYLLHHSQSPLTVGRSHAPPAKKLYNRRLGTRPHVIQVSDSASRTGVHTQPQQTRPWRQVNDDVSTRMIAMSSDSPPIIPKRDYDDSPKPRGRPLHSATTTVEQSGEDAESSDDGRQRIIDETTGQLVVYQGARPPHGAFDGSIYGGEPVGFMPCAPGPYWPMPMPPPPMFHPPPPPFFHGGMDGLPSHVGPDPGILFTPMGPMPMFDASKHRRSVKKAMKRSQSMELRRCGPPPMFMPPPGGQFMPPMGMMEAPSMQLMPFGGGPQAMMFMGGAQQPMFMGGPQQQQMFMPAQPPMMRMSMMSKRPPLKAQAPKPPKKQGACYLVCCKGHTQVLWIVVGIILIGIVLGLVLGLTLV